MAFRVEIGPQALADIAAIYRQIEPDAPLNAARWMISVAEAIYSLENMPARCPVASESEDLEQGVRFLLHGRKNRAYKIYFAIRHETPVSGTIRVLHVRHWAREAVSAFELQKIMDESAGEP